MNQLLKHIIIILLLGFLLPPALGKGQTTYTMEQLFNQAVENNHVMKKAVLQQSESNSKIREVIANGIPQLVGAVNYSRMGHPGMGIASQIMERLTEEWKSMLAGFSDLDALYIATVGLMVSQLLFSKLYLMYDFFRSIVTSKGLAIIEITFLNQQLLL